MTTDLKIEEKSTAPPKQGRLARAAGMMIIATLASRVLGQLRETAIAAWFGQNATTDVYRATFVLPDMMFFLIAGGVVSAAFVPVFTQYIKEKNEEDAWIVFSTVTTFLAVVVGAFVLLGEMLAPTLVPLIFEKFSPQQIADTTHLTRIILPGQLFFMLGAVLVSTLYVRGEFFVPALGPIIYNLAIIGLGWLLRRQLGIGGLCWGVLLGAFVGNFALQAVYVWRGGVRYRPMLRLRHPGVVKMGKLALPVIVGLSLPQTFALINRIFASWLEPGTMSALDNANKLMQIPLGIFGQAISIVAFPALSMMAAKGEMDGFRRTFTQGTRAMWFLTMPAALLMMVAAPEIVSVILHYGKFTSKNTDTTSIALAVYCTGLVAFSIQQIMNRAFYALHDTWAPMLIGTAAMLIFVILNFVMIGPWGYVGLAAAGSLAALIHMVWMIAVLKKRVNMSVAPLAAGLGKITLASLAGAGVSWAARAWLAGWLHTLPIHAKFQALASMAVVGVVGGAVFLGAARLLRCEEMDYIFQKVLHRRRPAAKAAAEAGAKTRDEM